MPISCALIRETLVEMPLNMETYYVISAEENWEAEMLIRVEGYTKKVVTRNA